MNTLIVKSSLESLSGYLPILKPKRLSSLAIIDSFRRDIEFVLKQRNLRYGMINAMTGRALEPFAEGLLTVIIGGRRAKARNFMFAEHRYIVTIEFGVDRHYGCIDGAIIGTAKIQHLNPEFIESKLDGFIGQIDQLGLERYGNIGSQQAQGEQQMSDFEQLYKELSIYEPPNKQVKQKYPMLIKTRQSHCSYVRLLEYNGPYARFDICCDGRFCIRSFSRELATRLDTKGSVVAATRTQEGPMLIDDARVVNIHELHLENYLHMIEPLRGLYDGYLTRLEENFDNVYQKYL